MFAKVHLCLLRTEAPYVAPLELASDALANVKIKVLAVANTQLYIAALIITTLKCFKNPSVCITGLGLHYLTFSSLLRQWKK